jgi:hypothetical protein
VAAGFGDTITLGGTRFIRRCMGIDDAVAYGTGYYWVGWGGGQVWWVLLLHSMMPTPPGEPPPTEGRPGEAPPGERPSTGEPAGPPLAERPPGLGEGELTQSELSELQRIANKYNTDIDVVGSRGRGEGRNIGTDLPFGKEPRGGTRSDIDIRIDGQLEIDTGGRISNDILDAFPNGHAEVHTRMPWSTWPTIRVSPGGKVTYVNRF